MLELYDAVILAVGAPHDRKLGIPGEDLPGVVGSAGFVGWYNGHPDFADLDPPLAGTHAAVDRQRQCRARLRANPRRRRAHEFEGSDIVGHALDALDTSAIRTITILGRRGPHQIAMTPKELGELGHLEAAVAVVESADFPPLEADDALEPGPAQVDHASCAASRRRRTAKPKRIVFDFFAKPVRIEGDGKAERIVVERTELDEQGAARGTGETYEVPASLVVSCIGYSSRPSTASPYDERGGKFVNDGGRIARAALRVGWARRGPTGTIGTNRPDGYEVADQIAAAMPAGKLAATGRARKARAPARKPRLMPTDYDDWRKIEDTEVARRAARARRARSSSGSHDWLAGARSLIDRLALGRPPSI